MCRTEMIVNANTDHGNRLAITIGNVPARCDQTARYPLVNARLRARHPRPGTLPSAKNDERRPGRAPAHAAPTGTAGLRAPRASNTTCAVGFGCVCVLCGMSPCAHKSNGRFKRACTDWIVLVCTRCRCCVLVLTSVEHCQVDHEHDVSGIGASQRPPPTRRHVRGT